VTAIYYYCYFLLSNQPTSCVRVALYRSPLAPHYPSCLFYALTGALWRFDSIQTHTSPALPLLPARGIHTFKQSYSGHSVPFIILFIAHEIELDDATRRTMTGVRLAHVVVFVSYQDP